MLTRSKARQVPDHSMPTSCNAHGGTDVLKGILKKTIGEPCGLIQPEWTGPMTRLRARTQFSGNISGVEMPGTTSQAFHRELNVLKQQNLQLKRGRPGGLSLESAPCPSSETISSVDSHCSAQSCPTGPSSLAPAASTAGPSSLAAATVGPSSSGDAAAQLTYRHPLNTLSLLPRPQRMNVLETLVRAFPITVPEEEVCNFLESREPSDLTVDLKRYFLESRNKHRNEFEKNVSVFRSECPWEPKWFTNFLTKLILTTKARPVRLMLAVLMLVGYANIYQYIFDVRQREQDSTALEKWKALSGFVRWTIGLGATFSFMIALCFLIDTYGEEGVSFSVPLVLFINIILNKILVNMNGALPSDF